MTVTQPGTSAGAGNSSVWEAVSTQHREARASLPWRNRSAAGPVGIARPQPTGLVRIALVDECEPVLRGMSQILDQPGLPCTLLPLTPGGTVTQRVDIALFDPFTGPGDDMGRLADLVRDGDVPWSGVTPGLVPEREGATV